MVSSYHYWDVGYLIFLWERSFLLFSIFFLDSFSFFFFYLFRFYFIIFPLFLFFLSSSVILFISSAPPPRFLFPLFHFRNARTLSNQKIKKLKKHNVWSDFCKLAWIENFWSYKYFFFLPFVYLSRAWRFFYSVFFSFILAKSSFPIKKSYSSTLSFQFLLRYWHVYLSHFTADIFSTSPSTLSFSNPFLSVSLTHFFSFSCMTDKCRRRRDLHSLQTLLMVI